MNPIKSVGEKLANKGFELKTLRAAGVVGGLGPAALPVAASALIRGGATPATAIRIAAVKHGDRVFLEDESGSLTFSEVHRRSNALARAFAGLGIGPGDGLAVMCRNHRGFVEANLAGWKLGATVILLNTMFSGPQLADVIEREEAKLVVLDQEFEDLLAGVPDSVDRVCAWQNDPEPSGLPGVEDLIAANEDGDLPWPSQKGRNIILTSGTTGTPKGAQRPAPSGLSVMVGMFERIPHREGETMVMAAPLFHSWGYLNSVIGTSVGARLVLQRRFDPAQSMELVDEYEADALVAVPVMLQRIMELDPEVSDRFRADKLKIVTLSGSALPGGLATAWMDRYGDNIYNFYGSTEVAMGSIATPEDLRIDPSTAGRPPYGTSMRLVDERGDEVPRGETGRIFIRNEMVFDGYTGGGNKESLDGFVSSGDIGHFDEHGLLFIDGRDDEMIVSGGENVFPAEVEDLISGHEEVVEAAVIGVEDQKFGQALRAYVVLRKEDALGENEVRAYVKANLASYKAPRDVVFLPELPRNATGKILKRSLG
ncbi:MAG: long-chain-fatty-acid--CoA ligase FadD2 [Solirubrobacterales bacterium]|nr:long-chain-fatty-acid--CoA ligase FadD2 [Solirubrobacterales bacterium]